MNKEEKHGYLEALKNGYDAHCETERGVIRYWILYKGKEIRFFHESSISEWMKENPL